MPSSFPPKRNDRASSSSGHSQAWLAAEALFSVEPTPAPAPPAGTDAPVVVVRKPVRPAEGDAAPSTGAPGDTAPRAPKIHRVGAFSDAAAAATEGTPSTETETETETVVVTGTATEPTQRRRRRRQLSGEVTIIRPIVEAGPQEPPEPVEIPEFAWPRYPKLMAHIDALRAEAAVLRAQERAQAIEWIRMAIEKYRVPDWMIESASAKR